MKVVFPLLVKGSLHVSFAPALRSTPSSSAPPAIISTDSVFTSIYFCHCLLPYNDYCYDSLIFFFFLVAALALLHDWTRPDEIKEAFLESLV